MSSRTLSSKVKIKTSELPPEVARRYGFFDDSNVADLDLSREFSTWRQDQKLKDGITNALYRMELDTVKPSFDVLSQTGSLRKGHHLRKLLPGDDEVISIVPEAVKPRRKAVRPHSYIEPSRLYQHLLLREPVIATTHDTGASRVVKFREALREPVHRETSVWHHPPRPSDYHRHQSEVTLRHAPTGPGESRVLEEYKDSLAVPVPAQRIQQRWSVYGSGPWSRSVSTPPEFHQHHHHVHHRPPVRVPVGDRLTRRANHEYAVGVKLAESQTDLDTFKRLLDKKFGSGDNYLRSGRSIINPYWEYNHPDVSYVATPAPSYHYSYTVPKTEYRYSLYSPATRVTRPSEKFVSHGYTDYVPYSTSHYYSSYAPSAYHYTGYSPGSYSYEPWYTPYTKRSYYAGRSLGTTPLGRYTTTYLY